MPRAVKALAIMASMSCFVVELQRTTMGRAMRGVEGGTRRQGSSRRSQVSLATIQRRRMSASCVTRRGVDSSVPRMSAWPRSTTFVRPAAPGEPSNLDVARVLVVPPLVLAPLRAKALVL